MTTLSSRPPGTQCLADELEKPLLDNRAYRVIKLPNELEALLIHDPDTDKAAASVDVNVGAFSDPEDMQGIAHAVEHVLFLGTQKYPGENDYNAYLTKNGGYSNAYTAACSTNYYFEVGASATSNSPTSSTNTSKESLLSASTKVPPLKGALDRFSQFFVHPLFSEAALDRELRAVDSENKKNLQSDMWRFNQLNKSLGNKKHPFHLFSTGNYELLHDDPIARGVRIREEFIKFYETHYSANRMKLAVLGREDLDTLQSWVEDYFTPIKNQHLKQLRWDGLRLFDQDEVATQVFVKPVMDQKTLELHFEYPDEEDLYESHPSRYLAHLIGHEGPGSILAYLKKKGWANTLHAGASPVCPGNGMFSMQIKLTEEGLVQYKEVFKIVFQYMAMLRHEPPHEWIVDEMAKLAEVQFRFKQKSPASSTVSRLSSVMQHPYPRDGLLSAPSTIRKFDPEGIRRGLEHLDPDNVRLFIIAKEAPVAPDQKEKWYGTEYHYEKIPQDFLQELHAAARSPEDKRPAELHLPGKNEFVPQRLDVEKKEVETPALEPKLIRNEENVRLWYKKDDQFWVPKANIDICLRSPVPNMTPLAAVTMQLYGDLLDDSLNEYAYDADLAGLDYSVSRHAVGMDVNVSGYNDKMHVLLEKVLESMRNLTFTQERFDIVKERLLRGMRNADYTEPFRQIAQFSRWLVSDRGWAQDQLLEQLPSVTADDVRTLFPQFLKQMHVELLVHGNLYKEDALRIADLVVSTLKTRPLPPTQWPMRRAIVVPPGSDYAYQREIANPDNINHCIDFNLFVGSNIDRITRAKLLLLAQMLNEPCFDQLRTKEQLGYVVGSGVLLYSTLAGLRILIQSEKDCWYLEERIDSFLIDYEKTLREMSQDEFEEYKIALINKRLEKLKNLGEESARFWHHVTSEVFDFEIVSRDVENIEPLTKDDILDFHRTFFMPGPTRAKVSTHLVAQASAEDVAAKIEPGTQLKELVNAVSQVLTQLGLTVDEAALTSRLEKIDLKQGDTEGIFSTLATYLTEVAGVAADKVVEFRTQGEVALTTQVFPKIGIVPKAQTNGHVNGEANGATNGEVNGVTNGKANGVTNGELNGVTNGDLHAARKTVVIGGMEEVKAWKSRFPVSAAAQPVKDLSEFEESEWKL
ncbi:LuxS/MPP-like metallohydrolase [Teratosphaeria nubilosa]|uniref:LuxS/MPP-like metallohydrolase n=1 Tax=Teratosphaeria nubilosa TaxID=161662 RepID=A0A6G1L8I5_9PEZI|nr:LuxS/MPP-like metallohydrolase [Teratosphaeria nubilosa]